MKFSFFQVQDIFMPPDTELHHPYRYGYTVHNGQQGLFKLDLVGKKYLKAIDFTMYQCVPKAVAFIPLGNRKFTLYSEDFWILLMGQIHFLHTRQEFPWTWSGLGNVVLYEGC